MRSFADRHRVIAALLILTLATAAAGIVAAQDTPAGALFDDAQALEVALRKEIGAYKAGVPSMPLIRRARILVGTYEDIARLFPDGGYGDKSLWQGARLAADVFDVFKDGADRASAVRLTEALESKYPSSSLLHQAQQRISTLALQPAASPAPAAAAPASGTPPPARPSSATKPAPRPPARPTTPASTAVLQSINREVLPDVLRVSLELEREVAFHEERIDGPPRVFVDLQNTRASAGVQDARMAFDDDVVRQIRVGRQLDRRVRVVLDLADAPRHSVYTLYNPFRIVIDFERPRAVAAAGQTARVEPAGPATPPATGLTSAPKTADVPPAGGATASRPPLATAPPAAAPRSGAAAPAEPVARISAAPPAAASTVPSMSAPPRRETVFTAPPPARTPGGLSISRQLGLGLARVVIDPGHGGQDPGAKQGAMTEAELVLDVSLRLEQLLQKDGIEVILTRRSNVYVPLEERPAIAMREEADLYVSIHANASADARVRGVETYILNFAPNAASAAVAARENMGSSRTMKNLPDIVKTITLNNKIDESRDLARQVQATLVEKLSKGNRTVRNLGVKQAPFAVLVGADMPSILAEIGFITNKQDAALVKTAVYRQQIAEALAVGIARYQKRLKPSQVAAAQ